MSKKFTCALAAFMLCVLSAYTFGQGINAVVGGSVSDPSKALIPGVTVTATNTGTGVAQMTVTNESGAYQFPALQPGTYKISAELPGFQTQTFTDVTLGGAQQITLNFTMQVAAAAGQQVEVTVAADTVLATTSNSIGTVLPEYKVRDLPAQTGNAFNLVANMPGVQRDSSGSFGYMAGGSKGDVNSTRDGINVNDGRYENGAWSTVYSPPDMIEEVKVVVAPVDAETSRGSGQVAMVTRSGTNAFRGSAYWTNHNSAGDANDWFNNFNGVGKSYDNRNLYGARLGGPIFKNKTFFFLFFTGQRDLKKVQATGTSTLTWTDMAKAGIFRYWPGGPGNQNATGANPAVDVNGNPVEQKGSTSATPFAIGLFGNCTYNGAPVPNCTPYNDSNRPAPSTLPYLQQEFSRMPSPNNFKVGDGLNTAGINFVRVEQGLDLTCGNGDEVNRDQYNARIDHNFNSKEKVSLIGTQEHTWGYATQAGLRNWPQAFDGLAVKRPVVYTVQVTSTLSSSMLNQFRMGKSGSNNWQWGSSNRNDAIGTQSLALEPEANGLHYSTTFASGIGSFNQIGGFGRWRVGINPRYSMGDDFSYTVRKHAFKMGYEFRRTESNGFNDQNNTPGVTLGAGAFPALINSAAGFAGLSATDAGLAANILYDRAGSVLQQLQGFEVISAQNPQLVGAPTAPNNAHWNEQNEMSVYFKDDWKLRPDFTLNLGLHWEYYGMPYEMHGVAARVVGNESSYLNVQCAGTPGTPIPDSPADTSCTNLAQVQFVGRNSTHPNIGTNIAGNDFHSFAPAIGFAYDVPWFGKGKTVIRSGYGISFSGALRNFITVDGVINTVPGINAVANGAGLPYNPTTYLPETAVQWPIPFPTGTATVAPFTVQPTQRSLGMTTYDYVNPYTQNWNLEIQREVAKNTTVEIRYVGTKGTKLFAGDSGNGVDMNQLAWLKTGGSSALFQAFQAARAGNDSALMTQLLQGVALSGTKPVDGTIVTGAQAFRTNSTTRGYIANGNFGGFLGSLNTTLPYIGGDANAGSILRHAGFPDNYLVPDPQYTSVTIDGNNSNSTYHALNLQVTRRLTSGFTNTTTYIWSKAMGAGSYVDPNNRDQWKTTQAVNATHQLTSSGSYELPFGTGHALLGNSRGWIQNIVSQWQMAGIMNYHTGNPLSFTSSIDPLGSQTGRPQAVGPIPGNIGHVTKTPQGPFYFNGYTQVTDPGFAQVSPACAASTANCNGLLAGYSNKAIADPNGNIIMENPQPGQPGNVQQHTVSGPGAFYFDANMLKRVRLTEKAQFEFRVDVINILNHPNFAAPSTAINTVGTFGQITSLASGLNTGGNGGMRSFLLTTRVNF